MSKISRDEKTGGKKEITLEPISTISFRVPKTIKTDFRVACIKTGKNMNSTLQTLVEAFVKTHAATIKALAIAFLMISFSTPLQAQLNPLFEDIIGTEVDTPPIDPASTPLASTSTVTIPVPATEVPTASPDSIVPAEAIVPEFTPSVPTFTPEPAVLVPKQEPIAATPVKPIELKTDGKSPVKISVEQLELGKISRTISTSELSKMDVELVATDKVKQMTVQMGDSKVNLELPIVGYLLKERSITPSPLSVPVASSDFGYKFSDNDMRNLKILYNSILGKSNTNPTTTQRFQEVLKDMENYIRDLDARKSSASEVSFN